MAMAMLRAHFSQPISYEDTWMDSPLTQDPALTDPAALLSSRIPSPTEYQKTQPVCILVHGFSASSFEFDAFKAFAQSSNILFSTVVMGGHGRDVHAFKQATYSDWMAPIQAEAH